MSINLGYFISEAAISFKRNWVMTFGGIATIFLSLLLMGSALLMNSLVNDMVGDIESRINIQVWIHDDAEYVDIEGLQVALEGHENVATVHLVDKDEALERFTYMTQESPQIVEQLQDNPLPRSLEIELIDTQEIDGVLSLIRGSEEFPLIADPPSDPERALAYGQGIVETLLGATQTARYAGIALVGILAVVSLIFINNTIRLAIYARRNELSIMRLVGASNGFIRAPFILEGILQALVGAILAILVLLAIKSFVFPGLQETLAFITFNFTNALMTEIALILLASGVVIGTLGAIIAMRRYLKI
ncbi:MAG: permease-like cell division protein FtsX [Coriobacteriia bacterium]|nr:permease-like cell division protein FtsX [Coriobacteriia bacterium]MCL2870097.1 permease-like cell division protein FtsX [Coriobacteriia bacterium]